LKEKLIPDYDDQIKKLSENFGKILKGNLIECVNHVKIHKNSVTILVSASIKFMQ